MESKHFRVFVVHRTTSVCEEKRVRGSNPQENRHQAFPLSATFAFILRKSERDSLAAEPENN